jgi:HEAT repeat protein
MNKNVKLKLGIFVLVTYFAIGLAAYGQVEPNTAQVKQALKQAVAQAKKGDRRDISSAIQYIEKNFKGFTSEELVPDYISYLKDPNGQVQWLGAMGLYRINNPKATKELANYLKGKNFKKLQSMADEKGRKDFTQISGEVYASIAAISALGLSGDKSYIPLLESLQGFSILQLEGGSPVDGALAYLGVVDSLANIPPDAEEAKIERASGTVMKIRDPNRVPQLMATVRNPKIADQIRDSALVALGEIGKSNPPGVADFLIKIFSDSSYSQGLRLEAAVSAGKTKDPAVEKPLLNYAQDPNSDIRQYAYEGLNFYMPEKYLDRCFDIIMDKNENLEFRKNIEAILQLTVLKAIDRRAKLFECLNVVDKDGRPINKIRIGIWRTINELYGEEAPITLGPNSKDSISTLKGLLEHSLVRQRFTSIEERDKKVNDKLSKILTVLPNDSEVKK